MEDPIVTQMQQALAQRGYQAPNGMAQSNTQDWFSQTEPQTQDATEVTQGVQQPQQTFSTPFKATGNEGFLSGTAKAIGNTPASVGNLVSNVASAVMHPVDTVKNLASTLVGGGEALGRGLGLASSQEQRPEEQQFNNVANFFKDRYGSVENLQKTAIEDPAGFAADLASVFSGGGSTLSKIGELSGISKISEAGNVLSKVGASQEPIASAANTAKGAGSLVGKMLPDTEAIQKTSVAKSLGLTPSDISNITTKTGNEPTSYLLKNDLLKNSPEETANALEKNRVDKMAQVRSEIGKVNTTYTPEQVPLLQQGLDVILRNVEGVPGLEDVVKNIQDLGFKDKYTLSDIQKAKEFIDQNSNIFSTLGDVKSAASAKGLANIRSGLKTFIESEVKKNTGGKVDISGLNNDVQTSYALQEAVANRELRSIPKAYSPIVDILLGGGGATAVNPYVGAGLVIGRHLLESPTFRVNLAKLIAKEPIEFVKQFTKENTTGKLSPATISNLKKIISEAQKNLPYVESASNALESSGK